MRALVLGGLITIAVTLFTKLVEAGTSRSRARRRLLADLELMEKLPESSGARAELVDGIEAEAAQYVTDRFRERPGVVSHLADAGDDLHWQELVLMWAGIASMYFVAYGAGPGVGLPRWLQPATVVTSVPLVLGLLVMTAAGWLSRMRRKLELEAE